MNKPILALILCLPFFAWANKSLSTTAAHEWLQLVDTGNYIESWKKSDTFFQSQLTQDKWNSALKGVRTPLGKVNSRSIIGAKEYATLPGAPDGEYVVIQFKTEFQHKTSAIETLTLSKSSGQWLPVGYFIK